MGSEQTMKTPLHILLIDDDEDEFVLLKSVFASLPERSGYLLDWAKSKPEAFTACQSTTYDVFLVDYYLGAETGPEVMNALRAAGQDGAFILLTGQASYENDLLAMQTGAADFLLKSQMTDSMLERSIRYSVEQKAIQDDLERRVQERTAELQATNEHLRESEQRFRTLADTTSAAIFILQEGMIVYANPAARFITGYAPDELKGQPLHALAHPSYRALLKTPRLSSGWVRDLPTRYELKIIHRSGEERWLDVTTGQMDYNGQPGWLLTAFDITERDRAERALKRARDELEIRVQAATAEAIQRAEELDALQRASAALLSTLELDPLLKKILSAAQHALPAAQGGMIFLSNVSTGNLELKSSSGPLLHDLLPNYDYYDCPWMKHLLITGRPMLVDDLWDAPELQRQCPPLGEQSRSLLAAPLIAQEQRMGVVALLADQPEAFTARHADLLASFAFTASAALENALLHAQVVRMAAQDGLTGLSNRRAFFTQAEATLQRARETDCEHLQPISAVMFDLDNFKSLNDQYGHPVGDEVLVNMAARIHRLLHVGDLFGRYGGDEFVLLLPGSDQSAACQLVTRILAEFQPPHPPVVTLKDGQPIFLTLSLGVTQWQPPLQSFENLLKVADDALYRAKKAGKNRLECG